MKLGRSFVSAWIAAMILLWAGGASAQLTVFNSNVPPGFSQVGFIQAATLDSATDPNSGGTLTINGITMIVPKNTVLQFPASTAKWADLFAVPFRKPIYDSPGIPTEPTLTIPAGKTGLALLDNPTRILGTSPDFLFNATVLGNIDVKGTTLSNVTGAANPPGTYIVGLILPIDQDLGNSGAGFITFIDYAKGRFEVGGTLGKANTGTVIEINDPTGRYGWAHSPDPVWSVDPDNPTVATGNGYPMCLPKLNPFNAGGTINAANVDPDCPITNRPLNPAVGVTKPFPHDPFLQVGAPLEVFFMPAAPRGPGTTSPDPWKKVPLMIGDFIGWTGAMYRTNPTLPFAPLLPMNQQTYISANTVGVDKLAVYTQPNSKPCYMQLTRMAIGTGGAPLVVPANAALGILGGTIPLPEPRNNIVIRGFVTDSTQLVDIFAVDWSPTNGAETHRLLGTVLPEPGILGVPPRGNKGRFRFEIGKGSFQPTTRMYGAQSRTGTVQLAPEGGTGAIGTIFPANGLLAGQYRAPMFIFQYPDAAPGFPVIPSNFNNQPFLFLGEGGNPNGSAGPLIPFPPFQP